MILCQRMIIPVQLISEFFKKNESIIQPLELDYTEEDYAGQRDSEGVLVLPEEGACFK